MSNVLRQFGCERDVGLLLVGHGSRDSLGAEEFLAVAHRVRELAGPLAVEPCFLEFAQPAIADGFRALASAGARHIVVVPVLLFAAGHAKRDIPSAVAAVAAEVPGIAVEQSRHLGCHEAILALSRLRYDEAVAELPRALDRQTVLVMVGRGSHDSEATAEMREFVELRARSTPLCRAHTAFVAMAEPRLAAVLDEVAIGGATRVAVQPHLLFGGVLVERIARTVADFAARYRRVHWVPTRHLGPSDLVAEAILSRAGEALAAGRQRGQNPVAASG
jgi:sirohydrochlorin cobaltochelatase